MLNCFAVCWLQGSEMAPKPAKHVSAEAQAAFKDDTSSQMAPPPIVPRP